MNGDSCSLCGAAGCGCGAASTSQPIDALREVAGMAGERETRWLRVGRRGEMWALHKISPSHPAYADSAPYNNGVPPAKPGTTQAAEIDTPAADVANKALAPVTAPKRGPGRPRKTTAAE